MRKLTRRFVVLMYCTAFLAVVFISQFTSNAVTAMKEYALTTERTVIIIDPGHGGIDGGATAHNGVLESKINLDICIRLRDLLHLMGYQTKMIRTTDTSIYTEGRTIAAQKVSDLKNRVRIVNETENGILISIHQNTFADSRYAGAQVFTASTPESKLLSEKMQSAFNNTLCTNHPRSVKSGKGIYLMDNIEATGILIECGFISNPAEAALLCSQQYQKQLICVIASTLSSYNANT